MKIYKCRLALLVALGMAVLSGLAGCAKDRVATQSDWNLAPEITDSIFAFKPPPGAEKISFPAQVPLIDSQGMPTPEQTGGQ